MIFTQRNGGAEGVSVVGSVCFLRVFFAKFSSSRHMDQQSVSVNSCIIIARRANDLTGIGAHFSRRITL